MRKEPYVDLQRTTLHLGVTGTIPGSYVSDPAVRLDLYAKLLRASALSQIEDLEEEFEDRFGEPSQEVVLLLRMTRLQLIAGRLGIARLEAGPKALAMTLAAKAPARIIAHITKKAGAVRREDRLIFETSTQTGTERLRYFERLLSQWS